MTLKELVSKTDWFDVESKLSELYPEESTEGYAIVFNKLLLKQPKPCDIIISFDEDEDGTFFSVVGKKQNDDSNYGIEFFPWSEWLGMEVDKQVLLKYNHVEIVVRCLWEMTYVGFDEQTIQHQIEMLEAAVENINSQEDKN